METLLQLVMNAQGSMDRPELFQKIRAQLKEGGVLWAVLKVNEWHNLSIA